MSLHFLLPIMLITTFLSVYTQTHGHTLNCQFHQYAKSSHYKSVIQKQPFTSFTSTKQTNSQQGYRRSSSRLLYGESRSQMRITLNMDNLSSISTPLHSQTPTTLPRLNTLRKASLIAQYFYQSRLKVSPQASIPIPSVCYDFSPPQTDITNSISNTDLHIYILHITDSTKAYSGTGVSCNWNAAYTTQDTLLKAGRPIVGRLIYNTYNIIDSKATTITNRVFANILNTCIHQFMHILGFDQNLYSTYLDISTAQLYAYTIVESVTLNTNRGSAYILKTPYVTKWAKQHYNCSTITGMLLQNQQNSGNAIGSHWERTSIYDQLMTGTELGSQKSFTALTYALLKDMGWYTVDDTFNDTTNYGYNKGCSFYNDACYSTTTFSKYFCNPSNNVNVTECATTFLGKAICSSVTGLMADGCGLWAQYFHCVDPDSVGDSYRALTLQAFGVGSFCVKGTLASSGITSDYRGRCYPYTCDYTNTQINITVGPYTVYCFNNEQGTNKTVSGLQGYIQCPYFVQFCTQSRKICPNWCSSNGYCTRGICNCYYNSTVTYSGADCSILACTSLTQYYHSPTASCVTVCPSGYYANVQARACLKCDSNCVQCRQQSTICTQCQSTGSVIMYYYQSQGTCVSVCPSSTYLSVDTCLDCDTTVTGCYTCITTATTCTSCIISTYYLNYDSTCVPACSDATYNKQDTINMKCVQTCPNYLYLDSLRCIRCASGYKQVDDANNVCLSLCLSGYYTDSYYKICGLCDSSCLQCSGMYSQNCTACKTTGTLLYLHLGMCLSTCPNGLYTDVSGGACTICDVTLFCRTCMVVSLTNSSLLCTSCKYGYYLQLNKTCKTGCDSLYYKNMWNLTCDPCSTQCKDCNGPAQTNCLNCNTGKYLLTNQTGGFCLDSCPPQGYVLLLSTTCLQCHETCKTCLNGTSSGCVTCNDGLFLESSTCRYVCSSGMYPNTTTYRCQGCAGVCQFCFGGSQKNCTQCVTGYVLDNFTCTNSGCPSGQKANGYGVCEKVSFQGKGLILGVFMFLMVLCF